MTIRTFDHVLLIAVVLAALASVLVSQSVVLPQYDNPPVQDARPKPFITDQHERTSLRA